MSGRPELRTRFILGPLMLLVVGLVFYADLNQLTGLERGTLSAGVLGLLFLGAQQEYVTMLRRGGFAVAGGLLMLFTLVLAIMAFLFGWGTLDRELYPIVIGTLLLLFPLAVKSLSRRAWDPGSRLRAPP